MRHILVLLLSLHLCACVTTGSSVAGSGTTTSTSTSTSTPSASIKPPELRLPTIVKPLREAVDLTLDPDAARFTGIADLDLRIEQPTNVIWLNATELSIDSAKLSVGGAEQAVQVVPGGSDFVGFVAPDLLAPGEVHLRIHYSAEVSNKEQRGLFRQQDHGTWYLYSQFEDYDARRAFPCFDEPNYKVPWRMTERVRPGLVALSNAPIESESPSSTGNLNQVRFAETPPLPSYLVAVAVGPFDLVDAGKVGQRSAPVRIVAPKGRGSEARLTAKLIPELLSRLEQYFGLPFPYSKLDLLAIPSFPGAMENAGLITGDASTLLAKPSEETPAYERLMADIYTHEMAHQWFGDSVTMAWWDDLWLNESFATWMETKILSSFRPAWRWRVTQGTTRAKAMNADSLVSARRIRQPIVTQNDIDNAFDAITYSKGSAVLDAFEASLGADVFQRGVQRYLREHAGSNATAADFLSALSTEAGHDIARSFSTFLDQPGVPEVSVELSCPGNGPATLTLKQQRYLPLGSRGGTPESWSIPICSRLAVGEAEATWCRTLEKPSEVWDLPVKVCPDWVLLDDDGRGYFVTQLGGDLLERLRRSGKLGDLSLLGLFSDVDMLSLGGQASIGQPLSLLPELMRSAAPHQALVSAATGLIDSLRDQLVPEALRPNLARFTQKTFGERAHALGFQPRPGEDDQLRLDRPLLLQVVGDVGEDAELVKQAGEWTQRYLADPHSVPDDLVDAILQLAAIHGDASLFERMQARAQRTQDLIELRHLLMALANFRDPSLVARALDLTLSDSILPVESKVIIETAAEQPECREQTWKWMRAHFDAFTARLPEDFNASLPLKVAPFCDEAHRDEVEAFFRERIGKFRGGPRLLDQALETIELCSALKREQAANLKAFLEHY
jgi:alanyl aminopeptidase